MLIELAYRLGKVDWPYLTSGLVITQTVGPDVQPFERSHSMPEKELDLFETLKDR